MKKKQNPGQRGLGGAKENQRRGSLTQIITPQFPHRQRVTALIACAVFWVLLPIGVTKRLISQLWVRHD